jgi:hypothetical protein
MFDQILQILSKKNLVNETFRIEEKEYFFIQNVLNDAKHIILASEKHQFIGREIKANESWELIYLRAKTALQLALNCLHLSQIEKYDPEATDGIKLKTKTVYMVDEEIKTFLVRLGDHMNAIYGLSDGKDLQGKIEELKARSIEAEKIIEALPPTNPQEFEPDSDLYHFD